MKQSNFYALLALLVPLSVTSAISPELSGDQYFDDGVHIEGVDVPEDLSSTTGSSEVLLGGTGTLTVGSKTGAGFPRVTVAGGTKITSTRYWPESTSRLTWWDGQFSAPGSSRLPNQYDIQHSSINGINVIGAYSWGLPIAEETFSFSSPARMVFPAEEADGQKVLLAFYAGGNWSIDSSDFCIVSNGLCYVEVSSMSSIALVKEQYQTCPLASISNGSMGTVPSCIVTCNRGYELAPDGVTCNSTGEDFFDEGEEDLGYVEDEEYYYEEEYLYEEDAGPGYEFPPGYFRYQGTKAQRDRNLDQVGLEGDDLKLVRNLNRGYYSQNARTKEEQVKKDEVVDDSAEKDSFLNYILQMRSVFTQDQIKNDMTAENNALREQIAQGEIVTEDMEEAGESETFHSGAPLLPSTGPEVFVTIAVIGFLMMLFGARRRN